MTPLKRLLNINQLIAWLIPLLLAGGCGYHFSGGGQLPQNVSRICVQVFENKTNQTGLEFTIANEIINIFTRFENVRIADKPEAQATLTGVIDSSSAIAITHENSYVSSESRIRIVVDIKLTASDGTLLWQSGPMSEDETYLIDPDKMKTEENKKSALATVSKRLAQRIYYRLTDNF